MSVEGLSYQVMHHKEEWAQYFKPNPKPATSQTVSWTPPEDFVKINSDGAFLEANKNGGWEALRVTVKEK